LEDQSVGERIILKWILQKTV